MKHLFFTIASLAIVLFSSCTSDDFSAGYVYGTLTDHETGEPVEGVTIRASSDSWSDSSPIGEATTDADGYYSIKFLYQGYVSGELSVDEADKKLFGSEYSHIYIHEGISQKDLILACSQCSKIEFGFYSYSSSQTPDSTHYTLTGSAGDTLIGPYTCYGYCYETHETIAEEENSVTATAHVWRDGNMTVSSETESVYDDNTYIYLEVQ